MELEAFCRALRDVGGWSHAAKIRLFAWHLHFHKGKEAFSARDIENCFAELHMAPPSAVGPFLKAMVDRRPPELIKTAKGYCLEHRVRETMDAKYGQRTSSVHVHKLLSELPAKIPLLAERTFLEEALVCFKNGAFRAATVMTWNLAFDHLCELVFAKHLTAFNLQLPKSFPKAEMSAVVKRDDFGELKEHQVLQVCRSANIISNGVHKILREKLDRRNMAAHPSGVVISECTAEEFVKDLVENVVLKLS